MPWLQDLRAKGGRVDPAREGHTRVQGGTDKRFVFQGVHMLLDGDLQREWKPQEKRLSRLVFIGRKLPEDKIRQGFEACLA